ncbi:MAG: hypothetical protein COB04_04925 [Gammaproteobacteria bacterium]|nr:MAG: hypothetical protein COB04_04925 [Gammaproteobacteria bacterium]
MIKKIKSFFESHLAVEKSSPEDKQTRLQLATAALLFEISKADFDISEQEQAQIKTLLADQFSLSGSQLDELVALAQSEVRQSTSLYDFTTLINDEYSLDDKKQIIYLLWRVAYADNVLDKYEEAMIRKVAELIYVPHPDFIQMKLSAKEESA